ncbi:SigE family RNA polymerase sigma factor [Micromonospora fluostatini]|uniref:SigE family RNA polymerase sigma factor n=1 Tax=Micromonospora sp. JCM 30529 TaxID=3421643 RepID=UPI003D169918
MTTDDDATTPGDSFDEFVRSRSPALLRSAYLLTTDRHAAEDLLQEVLERLYAKWRRARSAPDAYARKIMVNRATDRWRWRGRRPEAPLHDVVLPSSGDHADEVAVRQAVLGALRTLPPRQRAAVVLRYLDDLSEAETAQVMRCSVGAVKSHSARGLARLRAQTGLHHDLLGPRESTPIPVRRTS